MPEGKQFLAATLFAIMYLAGFASYQLIDKAALIREHKTEMKEQNAMFLRYVINQNERAEKFRDKLDSVNLRINKIEDK